MDTFTALADPTRRSILDMLRLGDEDAGTLAAAFDISQPAVSRHLKILRTTGIVSVRADAQRRIYSLAPDGLRDVAQWIERYDRFWNDRLTALEQVIEEGDDS